MVTNSKKMINYYKLNNKSKASLRRGREGRTISQMLPGCQIFGQDISSYALKIQKEIRKFIKKGSATNLKYKSNYLI